MAVRPEGKVCIDRELPATRSKPDGRFSLSSLDWEVETVETRCSDRDRRRPPLDRAEKGATDHHNDSR
jgi:hypothetical protein